MQNEKFVIFCQVLTHYLLSSYWKYVLFPFAFLMKAEVCYLCSNPLCLNTDESFGISLFQKGGSGGSS